MGARDEAARLRKAGDVQASYDAKKQRASEEAFDVRPAA